MARKNLTPRQDPAPISVTVEELTPQQAQVIPLLLAGKSQTEAAESVGVAAETITRWKTNSPAFVAAYNQARREQWEQTIAALDNLATEALSALGELMRDADPRVKLAAVKTYLDHRQQMAPPAGETDPARLAWLWEIERIEANKQRERKEFEAQKPAITLHDRMLADLF